MREIKFRAWDKKYKQWAHGPYFCINCLGQIYDKNQINITENFCIEQYTGIKDDTGKEIYEGDIISRCNYNSLYIVIYNDQYCKFEMNRIMDKYPFDFLELKASHEKIKIIGNIHENPELLERN